MENFNDFFNLTVEDFSTPSSSTQGKNLYFNPSPAKGKDGVYKAIVRFLPWHKDKKSSIVKKWACWLTNPLTDESRSIDCPSTVGKKSIIKQLYDKYSKSDSAADKKIAEFFSRKQKFYSLVQIVKDDNNPENVGKILIWNYGIKIYNKIKAEMEPEFGKPHIPFDVFEGKLFFVNVSVVGGYNNYDNCKFLDERVPIMIDGEEMKKTPEHMEKIKNFLETSPDLESCAFKDWDEETTQFVDEAIKVIIPNYGGSELVAKSDFGKVKMVSSEEFSKVSKPTVETKTLSLSSDDLDFDEELYKDL